jgi:ABC-type glycerol-3-phosphate transport system substrate-binding protein
MKTSVPEPNLRGQQEIHDGVLLPMLQDVIAGKAAPDAALRTAAAKANQILKNAD